MWSIKGGTLISENDIEKWYFRPPEIAPLFHPDTWSSTHFLALCGGLSAVKMGLHVGRHCFRQTPLLFSLIQVIIAVCSFPEFSNDTVSTFTQQRKVNVNYPHTKEELAMDQTCGGVFTIKYSFVYDDDDNLWFSFNYQNFCNKNVLFCARNSRERNSFSPVVRILLSYCSTNHIYSLEIVSVQAESSSLSFDGFILTPLTYSIYTAWVCRRY